MTKEFDRQNLREVWERLFGQRTQREKEQRGLIELAEALDAEPEPDREKFGKMDAARRGKDPGAPSFEEMHETLEEER